MVNKDVYIKFMITFLSVQACRWYRTSGSTGPGLITRRRLARSNMVAPSFLLYTSA